MQLVTFLSFLTASLHWRIRWTNSLTWRSDGLIQCNNIFLLKPAKLCFLSRFDYCNALLEKFNKWSTAQLLNLSTSLLYPLISTLTCFHVASGTAPPYFCELLHLRSPSPCSTLNTEIFCVPKDGQKTGGEILLIHQTCDLEHSSYLSGIPLHFSSQNWKTISSLTHTDLFLSSQSPNPSPV